LGRRMLPVIAAVAVALTVLVAFSLWSMRSRSGAGKVQTLLPQGESSSTGTTPATTTIQALVSPKPSQSTSGNYSASNVYVVILDSPACPHCRAQKGFFERKMPGIAYLCDVDKRGSTCMKAFALLFKAGVTNGIPTMIVCDNATGTIKAIVVGELESVDAWNKLFTLATNNTIPVCIGLKDEYKVAGYLKPKAGADSLRQLYQLLCIETLRDSSRVG
jgi:hypothetical protein